MTSESIDIQALEQRLGVQGVVALPRDASPRHYFRGRYQGKDAIIMLYPEKNKKNSAELSEFMRIGAWLAEQGIKAPEVYHVDEALCAAVLEDLGGVSFGRKLKEEPNARADLYRAGTDVLCVLRDAAPLNDLPYYKDSRICENYRQFVDYYVAFQRGEKSSEALVSEFLSVLQGIENNLLPCPQGVVHGDYHLENVMFYAQGEGLERAALIDYQDAFNGPLPYDLLNLLEDARVDVPADIKTAMQDLYCVNMNEAEKSVFMNWYRILAVEFHCRVIGLFIKLAAEQGRDSYLVHISRLQNYISQSLDYPVLEPLKAWMAKEGLDFAPIKDLDGNLIRKTFETFSIE